MEHEVYGASDDLVEVTGPHGDEFGVYDKPGYVVFSDGTVVKADYDTSLVSGVWSVTVERAGSASTERKEEINPDADRGSDTVTVDGEVKWVRFTTDRERAMRLATKAPMSADMIRVCVAIMDTFVDDNDPHEDVADAWEDLKAMLSRS